MLSTATRGFQAVFVSNELGRFIFGGTALRNNPRLKSVLLLEQESPG